MTLVQNEPKKIMIGSGVTPRLPAEYQEVEYIQLTGTQYLSSFRFPVNFRFTIKAAFDATTTYYNVYDTQSVSPMLWVDTSGRLEMNINYKSSVFTKNTFITVVSDATGANNIVTIDGTQVISGTKVSTITQDTFLLHRGASDGFKGKIAYMSLEDGNTKVFELIPCYRKADTVIGMYDLVNNVFYTNSGSGTFTKGNDVNFVEKEIKKIVIYPDGITEKQIRPAGWQPGANTTLYLPLNGDITDPYNQVTYNWVGTSSFATWSTGVQAANFTGSNAVALGTSKDFELETGEMTVLFWFTTTNPSTEQRCAFNVSGKYFIINRILNGKLAGSSNEYTVSGTTSIVANTKYLAAITRKENGKMCVYLNGNLEGQTDIGTFKSLPYQFGQHIGAGREGNNEFWRGMIKDFIIENKERTAQEILDYYNQTKGNYGL